MRQAGHKPGRSFLVPFPSGWRALLFTNMANYYGVGRSNYFKVKDAAAFMKLVEQFDCKLINKGDQFALLSNAPDGSFMVHPDDDDPIFIGDEIHGHLQDGEVAVFMDCGNEMLRYICGGAFAVHSSGKTVQLNLKDIYAKAKEEFGVADITTAEY